MSQSVSPQNGPELPVWAAAGTEAQNLDRPDGFIQEAETGGVHSTGVMREEAGQQASPPIPL